MTLASLGDSLRSRTLADVLATAMPRGGLVRFLANGVLNTAFGYAAFLLALVTGMPPSLALVAATIAGTLFNYQTARRLVFQSRRKGGLVAFLGVYALVLAVNEVALLGLAATGLRAAPAQALLVLLLALLSFGLQRRFVFPQDGPTQ